jgi:Beta-galactosidase
VSPARSARAKAANQPPRTRLAVRVTAGLAALATAVTLAGIGGASASAATTKPSSRPSPAASTGVSALGNDTKYSALVKDGLISSGPSAARLNRLEHTADTPVPVTPAVSSPVSTAAATPADSSKQKQWMVQIDFDGPSGSPWTLSNFQYLASLGLTGVEINLHWNDIEPQKGQFSLATLESYVNDAAAAHIQLVPIFWESVWSGNDPSWLDAQPEVTNTGTVDQQPAMWSATAYDAYATYVTTVLRAVSPLAGYGGSYIDYGWLDAMWGPPPTGGGMAGYAPVDIDAFHQWLPTQYRSIGALNRALGTDYATWSDVPAFQPGQPHFSVYQRFRMSSYPTIMSRLLSQVRQVTNKPIYLYFGGDMDDVGVLGNIPDQVFSLAKTFHAYVSLDDADNTALADLFGNLSQAYRVPLLNEWTPIPGNAPEVALWQGHYTLEGQYRLGEDYYIYSGGTATGTFAQYLTLHDQVDRVTGHLPDYKVGILVGYDQVIQGLQEERVPGGDAALADYIDTARPAAQVITDAAVLNHAVNLSSFKVLVDWSNDLTTPGLPASLTEALRAFQAKGGVIIPSPLVDGVPTPARAVPAAFTVSPATEQIETWTAVDGRRSWVTVANGEEDLPVLDTLLGGSRVTLGVDSAFTGQVTVEPASGATGKALTIDESLPAATVVEKQLER